LQLHRVRTGGVCAHGLALAAILRYHDRVWSVRTITTITTTTISITVTVYSTVSIAGRRSKPRHVRERNETLHVTTSKQASKEQLDSTHLRRAEFAPGDPVDAPAPASSLPVSTTIFLLLCRPMRAPALLPPAVAPPCFFAAPYILFEERGGGSFTSLQ
jgi:hypothetical protein